MNRREILKYTALATGGALGAPLISSMLSACSSPPPAVVSGTESLNFFTTEEFNLVKELADTLLPATDSPSASAVQTHYMIDHMVGNVYDEEAKQKYREGFDALKTVLLANGDFTSLDSTERIQALLSLENSRNSLAGANYLHLKQQTITYYLSSEEIGKNFLNYLPVPGEYVGCISLEEAGGRAWTL